MFYKEVIARVSILVRNYLLSSPHTTLVTSKGVLQWNLSKRTLGITERDNLIELAIKLLFETS
jgi:hypothetical protein